MKIKHPILWVILSIITCNISVLLLGKKLKIYKQNAWYTKWYYWVLGTIFGLLPALIMLATLIIQTTVKICALFDVGGKEIYTLPYVWIGLLIVPIIGWTLFIILFLYIYIMHLLSLFSYKS